MGFHCTLPQLIGFPVQSIVESNEWRIVKKIQDWKSMAETMGRVYKLLFVFLQDARGLYSCSSLMQRILDFFCNHLRFCFRSKIKCKL